MKSYIFSCKFIIILFICLKANLVFSEEIIPRPTVNDIKKVYDYYLGGELGPVLFDIKLCSEIISTSGDAVSCSATESSDISADINAYLWLDFFSVKDSVNNIYIRWNLDGVDAFSSELTFDGNFMRNVFFVFKPSEKGEWIARIFWEKNFDELNHLGELNFTVK